VKRAFDDVFLGHRVTEEGNHLAATGIFSDPAVTGDDAGNVMTIGIDECLRFLRVGGEISPVCSKQFDRKSGDQAPFGRGVGNLGGLRLRFRPQ